MTKVFSGGDMVNRTADAISAIADGLNAVKGIDLFLQGGKETKVNHSVVKSDIDKDKLLDKHYKMKHENGKLVAVKLDVNGNIITDSVKIAKDPDELKPKKEEITQSSTETTTSNLSGSSKNDNTEQTSKKSKNKSKKKKKKKE
jgi:hypothetical protein